MISWDWNQAAGAHYRRQLSPGSRQRSGRVLGTPGTSSSGDITSHLLVLQIHFYFRRHGVVACSGLKRSYRDILIGDADVRLVYLKGGTRN